MDDPPPFEPFPIPADQDMWVFAYGSLLWNPGFAYKAAYRARLQGYARRMCIASFHHRGTPERPGLVLGLDAGGSCLGLVYQVDAGDQDPVMRYLWQREMVTNVYKPAVLPAVIDDAGGEAATVQACTFVVDPQHRQYRGALDRQTAAGMIAGNGGKSGTNYSYLANTVAHLDELGFPDEELRALLEEVDRQTT